MAEKFKYLHITNNLIKNAKNIDNCSLKTDYYRVGDMVFNKKWRTKENIKSYNTEFPNSLATEYMNSIHPSKNSDLTLFYNIIQKLYPRAKIEDRITLHLRLGDVVEDGDNWYRLSVKQYLSRINDISLQSDIALVPSLKIIDNNLKNKPKHLPITIISGSHNLSYTPKSCKILSCIKLHLENKNYIVNLRLGKNADDDLVYMLYSKYHIYSSKSGSYNKLIKSLRKILF